MRRFVCVLVGIAAFVLASASTASAGVARDDAQTALNIIPSGQYGSLGPNADSQAKLYDGLTPLFDHVTNSDLTQYFKSEKFGIDTSGPGTDESVPRAGVTITRDKYDVPHVTGQTHDDGVWAAGWITAEDRGLLLQVARNNSYVAAIDAPGLSAIGLISNLQDFQPSQQTRDEVAKQTQVMENAGSEGKDVLHDIDTFTEGINAYLAIHSPATPPWTRTDIYALNALKGQFVGQGGGDEARRSQFLGSLEQSLGSKKGLSVFNDLRQFKNKGSTKTLPGKFKYGSIPKKAKGSAVLDPNSFQATPAVANRQIANEPAPTDTPSHASNELMVDGKHSRTKHPELVGGPQIGYFFPGFTDEMDMHAGDLQWRGATSAPFPGYLLIGRGPDFATTLTSSDGDIIDQYAETLCGGSDTKYLYKGQCLDMGHFDAGTLGGKPVAFNTTVHGPVVGYATVHGQKVAISSKRSSYGKDTLDQLLFRRLSDGQVHSPKTFFKAVEKTPQTFNSFYLDNKNIAEYTSGLLPIRNKHVDPGLPTKGTGQYEWKGFLSNKKHIHGKNPRNGKIVNWNNIAARGFGAADNNWGGNGSVGRVDLLKRNLKLQKHKGKWSLAQITSAMNASATQDVRAIITVPLLKKLLKGSQAPNAQAQQMLSLLGTWRSQGGNRLDLNNDGLIDNPGAAIMDVAWPKIANALLSSKLSSSQEDELNTLFSRFDQPPGGQYSGWYQYFDRDIRSLLGKKVKQPLKNKYCGGGKRRRCQNEIWQALADAGTSLTASQGTSDPTQWHSSATAEEIHFGGLPLTTMRYTNRPSGIQQVISFNKHG